MAVVLAFFFGYLLNLLPLRKAGVSWGTAIKLALGDDVARNIPISSTKSMTGHLMGAAGALESIMTILAIRDGRAHPTINHTTPDPTCDLDYIPNVAREIDIRIALKNSFGLGGQNACVVFGKWSV